MSQDIGLAYGPDYRTDTRDPIWDDDGLTADVLWGEHGIDALISPKPYVFWQSEDAAQTDMVVTSGEVQ